MKEKNSFAFSFSLCAFLFFFTFPISAKQSFFQLYRQAEKTLNIPDYNRASNCLALILNDTDIKEDTLTWAKTLNKSAYIHSLKDSSDFAVYELTQSINLIKKSENFYKEYLTTIIESYHLLGSVYTSKGDIEAAHKYFHEENELIRKYKPESVKYWAIAYADLSSYYSFKVVPDSEYYYAQKAYELLPHFKLVDQSYIEIVLRYAYATKVFKRGEGLDYDKCYPEVRRLIKFALKLIDQYYSKPSELKSQALQALANTYADYVYRYPYSNPLAKQTDYSFAESTYKRALYYKEQLYDQFGSSFATTCYTLALLYRNNTDATNSIKWFDKGIRALMYESNYGLHLRGDEQIKTPESYLLNVLLTNKVPTLYEIYNVSRSLSVLKEIHQCNLQRIVLWRQIFQSYESKDLGAVIAQWNHTPFEEAIGSAYELFQATHDSIFLQDIFNFSEESKSNDYFREYYQVNGRQDQNKSSFPQPLTLASIQKICKLSNTTLIEFASAKAYSRRAYAIMVNGNQIYIHTFDVFLADSLVNCLKTAMKTSDCKQYEKAAFSIHQLVLEPLLKKLSSGNKQIVICPDALFQDFPFEAVVDKMNTSSDYDFRNLNYLIHHYSISYALSGSIFSFQVNGQKSKSENLTVYFPTIPTKAKLIFSHTLYEKLKDSFTGSFFKGEKADKKAFLNNTQDQKILQVFSHARADYKRYDNSCIYLSGNPVDSVTIEEIYNRKINSDLTILACCESGSGPVLYGEGSKSMVRAFTFSGSRSVIGTMWSVDEKSTISILDHFYDQISSSTSIPTLLTAAKINYLATCKTGEAANPFYWSGLMACGSPILTSAGLSKRPILSVEGSITLVGISLALVFMALIFNYLNKKR